MNTEQQKILDDFTGTMDELNKLLRDLPEGGFDWAERKGEWSIGQIVHHLADDGNAWVNVIERGLVASGSQVFFNGYPGNEVWSDRLGYDVRAVQPSLDLLRAHRAFLAELVGHFPDRWQNEVHFYNEDGEKVAQQVVAGFLTMLTDHMQEHITMIENIIKAHQ